jgi:PAS domain S-box-containing protein
MLSPFWKALPPTTRKAVLFGGACGLALIALSLLIFSLGGGFRALLPALILLPLLAAHMLSLLSCPSPETHWVPAALHDVEKQKLEALLQASRLASNRMDQMLRESTNAENQARMQTRRLWEVFYQLNHPAGFLDARGTILDLNAAALTLIGETAELLRGRNLTSVAALGGGDVFADPLLRAEKGETLQFEIEVSPGSPRARVLVMSLKPVRGDKGNVELLILEGHDITERIRAEEALQETFSQFQQSQKMEAIGRLAGGIAHDFNNLLTSILGFSNMALDSLEPEAEVISDLKEVVHAATRAQNLTQKLLALSRKDVPDSHPLDLNHLLREMDNLIKVTLHENLELITELSSESCIIRADATSMEQVVINLAVNSRDAMPRSGRLYMRTSVLTISETAAATEGLDPGEYVVLSMRDTGCGMTPEILEHAFEPFFTTKDAGQGTGLGLSTVYAIVKQFQGVIRLESEPGVGTEFSLLFPRHHHAEQMLLNLPTHNHLPPLPRGNETVLLVEDEEGVRRMACKMLESLGYTPLPASDGEEGVRVAEAHSGSIDMIITDVVMPNLSGPEMIDRLRLSLGHIPHLYVSGFTMDKLKEHGADGSEHQLIRKPYSRETLARRIRETLDPI